MSVLGPHKSNSFIVNGLNSARAFVTDFVTFLDRISSCRQGAAEGQFGDLRIGSLLFADDEVLLASLVYDLQLLLDRFTAECEAARKIISTSKFEAIVLSWKKGGVPSSDQEGDPAPRGGVLVC